MENASQALILAASILLLIVALTVSISSFATLKVQVDDIIEAKEETKLATDESGNYINYIENADDVRTVEVETIISSLRRVRQESYTVYIYLQQQASLSDLSNAGLEDLIVEAKQEQKYKRPQDNIADAIQLIPSNSKIIKISLAGSGASYLNNDTMQKLYETLKDKKYKEYLGIYQEKVSEGVSDANKGQERRIITFVEQN